MKCDDKKCKENAMWFIGTAEVPVCNFHHLKWLEQFSFKDLQRRYIPVRVGNGVGLTMPVEQKAESLDVALRPKTRFSGREA